MQSSLAHFISFHLIITTCFTKPLGDRIERTWQVTDAAGSCEPDSYTWAVLKLSPLAGWLGLAQLSFAFSMTEQPEMEASLLT